MKAFDRKDSGRDTFDRHTFDRDKFEGIEIEGARISEPQELGVERFRIRFEEETLKAFVEDPDTILHKLLERWNRFHINSIRFLGNLELAGKDGGVDCYHVVSPEAEKSNTICL